MPLQIKKTVTECEEIPRFYGVGYRNPLMQWAECYPIPLNLLVGLGWRIRCWLKQGMQPDWFGQALAQARQDGYKQGYLDATLRIDARIEEQLVDLRKELSDG